MKTKVMMAAFVVACAFAMSACGNKKAAGAAEATDTVAVEKACCGGEACQAAADSCAACPADSAKCCKDGEKACDKKCEKEGEKSCCEKK